MQRGDIGGGPGLHVRSREGTGPTRPVKEMREGECALDWEEQEQASHLIPEGRARPLGGGFNKEKSCSSRKSFLIVILNEDVQYGSEPSITGGVQGKAHAGIDSIQTSARRPETGPLKFSQ